MTNEITPHTVNEEPRVLDIDLAERLSFERPRKVRDLIDANLEEIEGYGILPHVRAKKARPSVLCLLPQRRAGTARLHLDQSQTSKLSWAMRKDAG